MEISVSLIIAAASALVGLLCLYLFAVALLRKRKPAAGETPAELTRFALRQLMSATVMLMLAGVIIFYS